MDSERPDIQALLPQLRAVRDRWRRPPPAEVEAERPQAGQESVWDYPRPPAVLPAEATIRAYLGDTLVLESARALRIVETAGAPVYYAPPEDWRREALVPNGGFSVCEWKGVATQYDVLAGGLVATWGAFCYDEPLTDLGQGYERVAGRPAPHPARLACYLGDERARPQPGGLYAGWVTSRIAGPVKGGPGTGHW